MDCNEKQPAQGGLLNVDAISGTTVMPVMC